MVQIMTGQAGFEVIVIHADFQINIPISNIVLLIIVVKGI